jgi:tetratricopeptide (TPR) repeat protein
MAHRVLTRVAALLSVLALVLAAPASAQLGIDFTPGEKAKQEEAKKPDGKKKAPEAKPPLRPPAPVSMPELDVGARKGEAARRVAEANKVFARGEHETAALAYDAILRDPSLAEVHDEARYQLAKSLVKLGLNHSALSKLDEILSKGVQGSRYFHNALEWLFFVGKKTVNESVIVSEVVRFAGGIFPPASQDKFSYLLARYSYERGRALDEVGKAGEARRAFEEAKRLAGSVRPEAGGRAPIQGVDGAEADQGDVYAKARFLDGLVRYAQGEGQPAVEAFKEVVRLTNPRRTRAPDPRLRELAFLQLARIHYEHKQNRYAIFYYDKMPWGGESWLEGLWESSYAHYRIGNYEKALGNLLTLQSPYFRDEWFPESWILKAIIYYENCRYPEARAILDEFHATYADVHQELGELTARKVQPAAFFDLLEDAEKGRGAAARPMMRRIMKLALTDQNVKRLNDSILEVENEMDRGLGERGGAFRSSALHRDLKEKLEKERGRLVDEAGARAREAALKQGGQVNVLKDYRYSVAVSDDHLYWPYDGEFWRDELGTYTYTLTKGCRDPGVRATR